MAHPLLLVHGHDRPDPPRRRPVHLPRRSRRPEHRLRRRHRLQRRADGDAQTSTSCATCWRAATCRISRVEQICRHRPRTAPTAARASSSPVPGPSEEDADNVAVRTSTASSAGEPRSTTRWARGRREAPDGLLKTIDLASSSSCPATGSRNLSFVDPGTKKPAFASRALVEHVLDAR